MLSGFLVTTVVCIPKLHNEVISSRCEWWLDIYLYWISNWTQPTRGSPPCGCWV